MEAAVIRPFHTGDRDWLVERHRTLYAEADGFDESFGVLVGRIVDAFVADHDPTGEAGWIAECDGQRLGSIFCVRQDAETAKLRLFLLVPEARGRGLGRRMLETCTAFARACGYGGMRLWTHESHIEACRLYRAAGWSLDASKPVTSFGQPLVEQSWSFRFRRPAARANTAVNPLAFRDPQG